MKIKPTDNISLKEILDEMDIPENRKDDPFWLLRNMGIKEINRNHPYYEWAMTLLKFFVLPENFLEENYE